VQLLYDIVAVRGVRADRARSSADSDRSMDSGIFANGS
jgi:hypothetical protein